MHEVATATALILFSLILLFLLSSHVLLSATFIFQTHQLSYLIFYIISHEFEFRSVKIIKVLHITFPCGFDPRLTRYYLILSIYTWIDIYLRQICINLLSILTTDQVFGAVAGERQPNF